MNSRASHPSIVQNMGLLNSSYKPQQGPLLTPCATEPTTSVGSFAPDELTIKSVEWQKPHISETNESLPR